MKVCLQKKDKTKRIYCNLCVMVTSVLFLGAFGVNMAFAQTEQQISEILQQHEIIQSSNTRIIEVTTVGEVIVINLSRDILPDGEYSPVPFSVLSQVLDEQLQLFQSYMLTFRVEGELLEHWGMPVPDFEKLRISAEESAIRFPKSTRSGALTGKKIALSPSHGYYYTGTTWAWQRPDSFNNGIREDLISAEMQMYVAEYLNNLGANVIYLREPDKNAGSGSSGLPRWQEAARHYLEYIGAPSEVWNNAASNNYNKDIMARPYGANHYGADLLVSLHTNAGGGTGTETYYDTSGTYHNATAGYNLALNIHNNILSSIRTNYNSGWNDHGFKNTGSNYGEIHFSVAPAALIEVAYHDTYTPDNVALQSEEFKQFVAQGVVQGICDYYGASCGSFVNPVTVTSPNNQLLPCANNVNVAWQIDGISGGYVKISMKRTSYQSTVEDGVNYHVLASSTYNDGSQTVSIPSTVMPADDWRFWVKYIDGDSDPDNDLFNSSDENIVSPKLLSPNSGTYSIGDTPTFTWNGCGAPSSDLMTVSMKRDAASELSAPDDIDWYVFTPGTYNDGSYTPTNPIPSSVTPEADWHFFVKHNSSDAWDMSDSPITIQAGGTLPNLTYYGTFSVSPSSNVQWGDTLTINYSYRNNGTADIPDGSAFSYGFYLSPNSTISTNDSWLKGFTRSVGLPANTHVSTSTTVTLPSSPPEGFPSNGTMYIGMILDYTDMISESNESDNRNQGLNKDYDDISVLAPVETTPPSPNPMTFVTEPYALNSTSITMVATTATDSASPPVSYYFDFYSSPTGGTGGSDSSGWQSETTYTDYGLQPNHRYGYRVAARDAAASPNQTAYSITTYVYTLANTPDVASFSNVSQTNIQANWGANNNRTGTAYYCENTTNGTNSGWITTTSWASSGLTCGTSYSFRVKARNAEGNETGWTSLGTQMTQACSPDTTPPSPNPMTFVTEPYALSSTAIRMVATAATDSASPPVAYYFDFYSSPTGGTGGTDSTTWQSWTTYTDDGLQPNHRYGYRVKAMDSAAFSNETAYSITTYVYTLANAPGTASFSGVGETSMQTNWTANSNRSGTAYYCENTTAGTNSGWITTTSWVSSGLTCGTSYSFRVKARNAEGIETGWTSLGTAITSACQGPSNDLFSQAIQLSGSSGSITGTNTNATSEVGEPGPSCVPNYAPLNSVWWYWTASSNGTITLDTEGSSFDTILASYSGGSVNNLTEVECNDDIDLSSGNSQSRITFSAQSGMTYRITVDGYSSNTGNIVVNWNFQPAEGQNSYLLWTK